MYMYNHANTLGGMHACAHLVHTRIYTCHDSYEAHNDASDQVWNNKKTKMPPLCVSISLLLGHEREKYCEVHFEVKAQEALSGLSLLTSAIMKPLKSSSVSRL